MNSQKEKTPSPVACGVLEADWEYADANTQHLTHNIHRYSGKFIPQIAARSIELLTRPGELVVDPYCGSGTTLVECAQLGRRGVGVDLNPLAVLIARVKTTPVSKATLDKFVRDITKVLLSQSTDDDLPLFAFSANSKIETVDYGLRGEDEWYRKWFQPHVLSQLLQIDAEIRKLTDMSLRCIARVAFSDILRRSSNAHAGYPNVMFDRKAPKKERPIRPFLTTLARIAEKVATLANVEADWGKVRVIRGDATALPMDEASVDAIISHPPYIGSIPYAEYGVLSLQWLGADSKQLDRQLTGGRRQSQDVVARFEYGYQKMLLESARVLKPGRYAFLMVGNPIVRGEVVDLSEMTQRLASNAGLSLVAKTERQGVNRRANKMGAEHLLFFQKASNKRNPVLRK